MLLGINTARPTSDFRRGDSALQFLELGRQLIGSDRVVGQLCPALNDRSFDPIQPSVSLTVYPNVKDNCRSRTRGQQAGRSLGQCGRIQAGTTVGKILRGAANPGLAVHGTVVIDKPGDIGDRVMQEQIGTNLNQVERLIKVRRRSGIQGDKRPVGSIDMTIERSCGSPAGVVEHIGSERAGDLELLTDLREPTGKIQIVSE